MEDGDGDRGSSNSNRSHRISSAAEALAMDALRNTTPVSVSVGTIPNSNTVVTLPLTTLQGQGQGGIVSGGGGGGIVGQEWRGVTSLSGNPIPNNNNNGNSAINNRPLGRSLTTDLTRSLPNPIGLGGGTGGLSSRLKATTSINGNGGGVVDSISKKQQPSSSSALLLSSSSVSKLRSRDELAVRRLGDEVQSLSERLDESYREKAQQQAEINRLRQELIRNNNNNNANSGGGGNGYGSSGRGRGRGGKARKGGGVLLPLSNKVSVPGKDHLYHMDVDDNDIDDDNDNDDGGDGLGLGMGLGVGPLGVGLGSRSPSQSLSHEIFMDDVVGGGGGGGSIDDESEPFNKWSGRGGVSSR
eukprot:gene11995-25127_t